MYVLANIGLFFVFFARVRKKYRTLNRSYRNNLNYAVAQMRPVRNEVVSFSVFFPLLWVVFSFVLWTMRRMRNEKRICSRCQSKMHKMSEKEEDAYLDSTQQVEERLHTRDYDVWVCSCGMVSIENYRGRKYDRYHICSKC